jgi:integrase
VQAPKASREERRAWSREEVRRFLAVAPESHYGPVWLLMATTGMRRGEVLGLRWKDVNLDGGVLVVQQAIVAIDGRMTVAPPKGGQAPPDPPLCRGGGRIVGAPADAGRAPRRTRHRMGRQ